MTLSQRITKSQEGMRLWQQERMIFEVTELICELMDDMAVSRSELAARLNKTKSYVTQLLDGETNMTIRTISDVFTALNRAVHVCEGPMELTNPRHSFRFAPDWKESDTADWKPEVQVVTS